jgi:hypothetical protein
MIAGMAPLLAAVQRNCDIADARHAREMTLCTYLLEMREFYRWEHDLALGAPPPREDLGRWIAAREARWDELAEHDFAPLPLAGREYAPFDLAEINARLLPEGLVYGAGIGRFGKAHFFLGRLERRERSDELDVLVCDCEYARDLTAIPAALQDGTIIIRREALRQWLWEKAEAWGIKRREGAMARALAAHGYADDAGAALARMTEAETETLILHERGEHAAGRLLGPEWPVMLASFDRRRPELLARAVRDHLADCLSTLPALLAGGNWPSLHFWFANLEGLRRELFPALVAAYEAWLETADTAPLDEALAAGRRHWLAAAERLLALHRRDGAAAQPAMAAMAGAPDDLAL